MNILFIDSPSIQNSIRIGLMEQMAHHEVHLIDDAEEAMAFYLKEKPAIVIIDFTIPSGSDILYKLFEINPLQHIIILSDSLNCSEPLGCDYCLEKHKQRRVLKHQGIHDLLYLIDNFAEMPCEHARKFDAQISKQADNKDLTL